jgi:hypothetical protein
MGAESNTRAMHTARSVCKRGKTPIETVDKGGAVNECPRAWVSERGMVERRLRVEGVESARVRYAVGV